MRGGGGRSGGGGGGHYLAILFGGSQRSEDLRAFRMRNVKYMCTTNVLWEGVRRLRRIQR